MGPIAQPNLAYAAREVVGRVVVEPGPLSPVRWFLLLLAAIALSIHTEVSA